MVDIASSTIRITVSALVGAIAGSFVGAATLRVPRRETVVGGRSHCDGCGRTLGASELVPVLSYILLRGRCRTCGAAIAIDQPVAEVGCAIVGVVAALSASAFTGVVLLAIFGWTLVALALLDARRLWLPDMLTLPLLLLGLAASALIPEIALTDRLLGAFVGYAALEVLRRVYRFLRGLDGLGAGDAKMFGAIGAWLGLSMLPWVMLVAASLGLAYAAALRGSTGKSLATQRLPLGSMLSIAAVVAIPFAYRGA